MKSVIVAVSYAWIVFSSATSLAVLPSTLNVQLVATPLKFTPGLYNVAIQVFSSNTTSGVDGDGGLSGMRFDILSNGHGLSEPLSQGLPNFVKTSFPPVIAFGGFSTFRPQLKDAVPADNPGDPRYDQDGDLDAVAGASSTWLAVSPIPTLA